MHRSTGLFSSLLFLGFAVLFFCTNPSPLVKMAEEIPKSIHEFTVKVPFFFFFFSSSSSSFFHFFIPFLSFLLLFFCGFFFMNLFGFVKFGLLGICLHPLFCNWEVAHGF